jgi:hypothetical protein
MDDVPSAVRENERRKLLIGEPEQDGIVSV